MPETDTPAGNQGPATDRYNEPVIDPTKNVLDLVEAAINRQDDLRKIAFDGMRNYVDGQVAVLSERLGGIDKAEQVFRESLNNVPTDLQRVEGSILRLMDERDRRITGLIDLLRLQLNERYETQVKAVDAALAAQIAAMQTAFVAAEKAVDRQTATLNNEFHEHLVQYRHEVTLAFEASDKAISKAEQSNEKRFEQVDALRVTVQNQASQLLTRSEAEARIAALTTKVDDEAKRTAERLADVNKRLDLSQGGKAGAAQLWAIIGSGIGLLLAVLGIVAYFNAGG